MVGFLSRRKLSDRIQPVWEPVGYWQCTIQLNAALNFTNNHPMSLNLGGLRSWLVLSFVLLLSFLFFISCDACQTLDFAAKEEGRKQQQQTRKIQTGSDKK